MLAMTAPIKHVTDGPRVSIKLGVIGFMKLKMVITITFIINYCLKSNFSVENLGVSGKVQGKIWEKGDISPP